MLRLADTLGRFDPDAVALIHADVRWTWGELNRRSQAWASQLVKRGVAADDLVAFALPNGPEFIALAFGIYRAGATPAPLSPKLPARELTAILDLMKPAAVVRTGDGPEAASLPETRLPASVSASWKACTSGGSTGRPKVIIDGRSAAFPPDMDFIRIPVAGRVLVPGPLYHNATFSAAIFALWKGCTLTTMPRFDAAEAARVIASERIDWAMMVPTMMQRMLRIDLDKYDLSSWNTVVHTAAPMPPAVKRQWIDRFGPDHIWEAYGATEGIVRTLIGGSEWLARPGSVGRPTGGSQIRIVGENGASLPPGAVGEIFAIPAGGPGTSYRYIGAERRATADGWESVGDFGSVDQDGFLYLADRRADLIISGRVNIWPAEVEAALAEHPGVLSCAVVGVPDEDLGQHVHAVVETADPQLDLSALRLFLTDRLAPEKAPRSLAFADGPVRDDAGKVRKSQWIEDYRRPE